MLEYSFHYCEREALSGLLLAAWSRPPYSCEPWSSYLCPDWLVIRLRCAPDFLSYVGVSRKVGVL